MRSIELDGAAKLIFIHGPSRVVISAEGEAVGTKRARVQFGVEPDIIFIREDGWSLGAPEQWAEVAEATWKDKWIGVLVKPSAVPVSYLSYQIGKSA